MSKELANDQPCRFSREVENLIANLRGVPENRSRARFRPTQTIGELLERCTRRGERNRQPQKEAAIMSHWAEIVGDAQLCHRCRPVRLTADAKLVVAVVDPVLRQELQFHRKNMLRRLQRLEGCQAFQTIVLIAG